MRKKDGKRTIKKKNRGQGGWFHVVGTEEVRDAAGREVGDKGNGFG